MMVSKWSWRMAIVLATVVPVVAGYGVVYVMAQTGKMVLAQATPPTSPINALSQGEMTKFVFKKEPEPIAEVKFLDGTGATKTLGDFKGRVVLLNIWATWCVPCRKEMPALDKLQAALGSDKFEVVALSVDRAGVEASRKFLDGIKVANLKLYADPTARMNGVLKVFAMPSTILIDAQGREVGRLLGEAAWDSEDAKMLIKAVLG